MNSFSAKACGLGRYHIYHMYIIIGIIAFFLVLQAVTARLEKRMVWPYGNPEAEPQFGDASGYGVERVTDALRAGFSLLGWVPDLKGARYRVSYALLTSPELDCFVIVGAGRVLSVPVRGTWIYTHLTNGTVFYSTDNQACVEIDVSRHWRSHLVRASNFLQLLQRHRDFLRARGLTARPFTAGRAVEEFRRLREEHFQSMSRQGFIAFTDGSATHWRYTFWGALKWTALNYSIGLLRAISFGNIPRSA
jgi:hypothetical protein